MLKIPASFKNNGEDYITIPVIHNFAKSHGIKTTYKDKREELLEKIIVYGNESEENASVVLEWIDDVIQEGIKDIHLKYAPLSHEMEMLCKDKDQLISYLDSRVSINTSKHICQNEYKKDFSLINIDIRSSDIGEKIVFMFCKRLYVHDVKQKHTKVIDYPVVAEYYFNGQWLLIKAKPKSDLYVYSESTFNIDVNDSTTTEKQIREVLTKVKEILKIQDIDNRSAATKLKNRMFVLLDKYTTTPKEIIDVMSSKNEEILDISNRLTDLCTVKDKCYSSDMIKDVEDDIKNIVEKYLSINWKEKDIFIQDRNAYPVKLSATDEEESKVEQTAAACEPLQTKALFFDNKKMLYKNRSCDGIVFMWKRESPVGGQNAAFRVKMLVNSKGECIFKFTEYTVKEDIENVIFSIVGATEDTQ